MHVLVREVATLLVVPALLFGIELPLKVIELEMEGCDLVIV